MEAAQTRDAVTETNTYEISTVPLLGGKDSRIILNVASKLLTNNAGQKRPFKVALDQLMTVLNRNAKEYYTTNAEKMNQSMENFIGRIQDQSLITIYSSPEILCTLAMCDLNIPSSRNLLLRIKENWTKISDETLNFHSLTIEFAKQSITTKREDDKSKKYWEDIEFDTSYDKDGFELCGKVKERIEFANQVTLIAYRYFLRYLWINLFDVPKNWRSKGSFGLYEWIEETSRKKNRELSLVDFRDHVLKPLMEKKNPIHEEPKKTNSVEATKAKSFYKAGIRVSDEGTANIRLSSGRGRGGGKGRGRGHSEKNHSLFSSAGKRENYGRRRSESYGDNERQQSYYGNYSRGRGYRNLKDSDTEQIKEEETIHVDTPKENVSKWVGKSWISVAKESASKPVVALPSKIERNTEFKKDTKEPTKVTILKKDPIKEYIDHTLDNDSLLNLEQPTKKILSWADEMDGK